MTDMPSLALLAGGLATRMKPLTERVPKSMLEVAGEPFIAHQLRLLRREGISHVVMCVGYLSDQIQAFVGNGSRFGVSVDYKIDGPELLGTGGALAGALEMLGTDFLVMYGDSWLDTSFRPIVDAYRASGKPALMTVYRNDGRWDQSNVWFENASIRLYDKRQRIPQMHYIDWGLGMIDSKVFLAERAKPFDLSDIYSDHSRAGQLAGYEVATRFYEIGSIAGLKETDDLLRSRDHNL
jgi:MurNAc alpha-1-phosphate uridylyltransferase